MLRPDGARPEDRVHAMGRADDAPAAQTLGSTLREKRQDLTSAQTSRAFTFTAPLGFVTPNDSRTCYSPWSVFQDGSGG